MGTNPEFSHPEVPEIPNHPIGPAPEYLPPPTPTTPAFELPDDQKAWLDIYELASAKIKELNEQKEQARNALIELARQHGADVITRDGRAAATVNWNKPTTKLDTKTFKAEHPKLYEKYAVHGTCVEFRLKG